MLASKWQQMIINFAADFTPISKKEAIQVHSHNAVGGRLTWIPRSQVEVGEVDDVIVLLLESKRIN